MHNNPTSPDFTGLPIRGVLALAIRCAQRVLPLAFDTPLHDSLTRAIHSASFTSNGTSSTSRRASGMRDCGEATKVRQDILDCLSSIYANLVECDYHVLSYFWAMRDSEIAADNIVDGTHDVGVFSEDRERAEANADAYGSARVKATTQSQRAMDKAREAAFNVFSSTRTLVYESAGVDLHSDLELMGKQYLRDLDAATNSDLALLRSRSEGIHPERFAIRPRELGELWPAGIPDWGSDTIENSFPTEVSPPILTIVWDPELVTEDEYAEIVAAVGDLVRSEGGLGVERLRSEGYGIECSVEVQP